MTKKISVPGFALQSTGGGNSALVWQQDRHRYFIMLTNEDLSVPNEGDEIVIGLYRMTLDDRDMGSAEEMSTAATFDVSEIPGIVKNMKAKIPK